MSGEALAIELLKLAAIVWPAVADMVRASSHPDARRIADILPVESDSAKAARELSEVP